MSTAETIRRKATAVKKRFHITEHKFFLLFVYLIAVLLYYPYVKENSFSYTVFRIVGSAGIFLAVYAVKVRRTLLICAVLLAIPARLQRILLFRADAGVFSLIGIALSFAFDVFIIVMVFRHVFTEQQPNSETVFGALCIYLLVGFSFASVYGMMATLQPERSIWTR